MADNRTFFQKLQSVSAKETGAGASEIVTLAINATGSRIVNARTDKTLRIWRCGDRFTDSVTVENAHTRAVESISWNPLKELEFATAGRDSYVKIWRANGKLEEEVAVDKQLSCHLVQYSADGQYLLVGCRENRLLVMDVKKNYEITAQLSTDHFIYSVAWFHHQHSYVAVTFQSGTFTIYNLSDGLREVYTGKGHRSGVTSAAVDPRGRYFAVGSSDGIVSLWSTATLVNEKVLTSVDEAIAHTSLSRDGSYIGVAYDRGSNVRIFDYETLDEIYEVPNSSSGSIVLSCVHWFPNKTAFIYTGDRGRTMVMMRR